MDVKQSLDFDATRSLITRCCPGTPGERMQPPADITVYRVPAWVETIGMAMAGAEYWLWMAPAVAPGGAAGEAGQIVLHTPDGRYVVETFDTDRREWIARESCAASPLVAGLPFRGAPLVMHIRPVEPDALTA